jgi:hypothetical protein
MDTLPEKRYDAITYHILYFAVLNSVSQFVDKDRQWFKSSVGLERPNAQRDFFCHIPLMGGSL